MRQQVRGQNSGRQKGARGQLQSSRKGLMCLQGQTMGGEGAAEKDGEELEWTVHGEYRWREWEKNPSTAPILMAWENWWVVVLLTT